MIHIYYTNEQIESELGPNFYWLGEPSDYLKLVNDLYVLGYKNDAELDITLLSYIVNHDIKRKVIFKSSIDGNILFKVMKNYFLIFLPMISWRSILHSYLALSFGKYHDYIDDLGDNLLEEANYIISSEISTSNLHLL